VKLKRSEGGSQGFMYSLHSSSRIFKLEDITAVHSHYSCQESEPY